MDLLKRTSFSNDTTDEDFQIFALTKNSDQTGVSASHIGKAAYHSQVALQETPGCEFQTSDDSRALALRVGFRLR